MSALEIRDLVKSFDGPHGMRAIDAVSLDVPEGELLVLLGPSGCGKTTLLRCIAGLERAQQGRIVQGGTPVFDAARRLDLPTHRRDIGLVFQNYSLWPHMSVRRNVEFPLRARNFPAAQRRERVEEVLRMVQCEHFAERHPAMLSGGQQQRIALARAIAPRPGLLLLDEPLSNLDSILREDLRGQLRALHRSLGFTGIYVTHDQTEAFTLGTRVAVMRAGRIEQIGSAEEVNARPASAYVARFLGIRNVIALRGDGSWTCDAGQLGGDLSPLPAGGGQLDLYVRSEDVGLRAPGKAPDPASLTLAGAIVMDAVLVGREMHYLLAAGAAELACRMLARSACWRTGETVDVQIAHDALLFYRNADAADGGAA